MIERRSILIIISVIALTLVSVPSVLFNNALNRYFTFMGNWSVASVKPSRNAIIPPMHPRAGQRADRPQAELRFVKFTVKIAGAKKVKLAGNFNKWNRESIALTLREKNTWGAIVPLPPGTYQYLYDIDGQLILDPLNPETAMSADRKVSVVRVK